MKLQEYAEYLAKRSPVVWIEGVPWNVYRSILQPLTPPHQPIKIDRAQLRDALRRTKARLARWGEGWDTPPCGWWHVCCDDREYDLAKLSGNRRRSIKKALRSVEVRMVDRPWFNENGYEVFAASFEHYEPGAVKMTREQFAQAGRNAAECPGYEIWGAFIEGKMVAYLTCLVLEDMVHGIILKWMHEYRSANPNDALFYTLTRHYLVERGVRYVTTGRRVVHHETNVQEYALTFGYRRVYCHLHLEMSALAALVLRSGVATWGKYVGLWNLAPHTMRNIQAVKSLVDIARSGSNAAVDR